MDERERERERQRTELYERVERNRGWYKRLKLYYIGLIVPWILDIIIFCVFMNLESHPMILVYLMVGVLVLWAGWCVFGTFLIRCPHCDGPLNRAPLNMRCCPYCGTRMDVYEVYKDPKDE